MKEKRETGFALFATLLMLLLIASLGSASLVYSTIDLKSSTHYRTGTKAFMAAEAGILHAISEMNTTLVWNFEQQLTSGSWTEKPWLMGTDWHAMPGDPDVEYRTAIEADPADPDDLATITAFANGTQGSHRVVRVRVRRDGLVAAPGAVYLINEGATADFRGTAFSIDGNDHELDGTQEADNDPRPGISVRNETVRENVIDSMSSNQRQSVQGLGYEPASDADNAEPSVLPSNGPNAEEMEQIVDRILTESTSVTVDSSRHFNGTCDENTFGTTASPQVTHLTHTQGVRINGDFCGAGILVVDGSLDVLGSMSFTGWIIARDSISLTGTGNATIVGSVWTNGIDFGSGGSLMVKYSTDGLNLASSAGNNPNGNVPRLLTVLSWEDI